MDEPIHDRLAALTLTEAAAKLRSGEVRSLDLTLACLDRIHRLDPELHAFITVTDDLALEQATVADTDARNNDWHGPLHGIPVALKDLIDVGGVKTTAGSALFADNIAGFDAEVTKRLR